MAKQRGKRGRIIRPFLSFYKAEVEQYCELHKIPTRIDTSNLKTTYSRNMLRLEVIPWLEEKVNPSLQESLVQLGEIASAENDYMDEITREMLKGLMKSQQDNKIVIRGKLFMIYHLALQRRMIKLIFSYLQQHDKNYAGFIHINQLCEWISKGRTPSSVVELPGGVYAWKEYGDVIISTQRAKQKDIGSFCYR